MGVQVVRAEAVPSNAEMWRIIQQLKTENQFLKESIDQLTQRQRHSAVEAKVVSPPPLEQAGESGKIYVSVGGFIRADAGFGDRYGDAHEDDSLSISRAAMAVTAKYQNVEGVFVLGTELSTRNKNDEDGNIDIKDAFIVVKDFGMNGFDLSVGAQPLLFGLKPNGYPSDHSLRGSIEYGGAGAFAVAEQAGPSIIGNWEYAEGSSLRFGFFDQRDYLNSSTVPAYESDEGSAINDNFFIQWRSNDLFDSGVYASLGYELRYVGDTVNDSEDISFIGLGWKNGAIDFSLEFVDLDKAFNGTADDESYFIAESSWQATEKMSLYLDYAQADELDVETYRFGLDYDYNQHTKFSVEFTHDDLAHLEDESSVDFRMTLSY
jgi:hypothetical protein